ncbi:MAG: TlyA family RNA methyltransferase [Coriobacteriia bacterium]|nr:TlyA family RNA methyltransferase [Coriobacteriia bacterium]
MTRRRIDALLVDRGFFASRERARAAVLAGEVRVAGEVVNKAGHSVDEDAIIEVAERRRFVSRGGEKLDGALTTFGLDVAGVRAVDVGASTGGFTDCLLQRGAASVVAVDVGYGQLAWSLRSDPRVTVFERLNIRAADPDVLGAPFELVVIDVSFISLRVVMPHLLALMAPQSDLVALVKPQFEAGKGRVGKRGVVKDAGVHQDVLEAAVATAREGGLVVRDLTYSPIKGPEGNIEFWMWAARSGDPAGSSAESVVQAAHDELGG